MAAVTVIHSAVISKYSAEASSLNKSRLEERIDDMPKFDAPCRTYLIQQN